MKAQTAHKLWMPETCCIIYECLKPVALFMNAPTPWHKFLPIPNIYKSIRSFLFLRVLSVRWAWSCRLGCDEVRTRRPVRSSPWPGLWLRTSARMSCCRQAAAHSHPLETPEITIYNLNTSTASLNHNAEGFKKRSLQVKSYLRTVICWRNVVEN